MKNPTINMMPLTQRLSISKSKRKSGIPVRQAAISVGQKAMPMGKMGQTMVVNKGSKQARPPKTGGKAPKGKAYC